MVPLTKVSIHSEYQPGLKEQEHGRAQDKNY